MLLSKMTTLFQFDIQSIHFLLNYLIICKYLRVQTLLIHSNVWKIFSLSSISILQFFHRYVYLFFLLKIIQMCSTNYLGTDYRYIYIHLYIIVLCAIVNENSSIILKIFQLNRLMKFQRLLYWKLRYILRITMSPL